MTFDIHNKFITGVEATQGTHEFSRGINLGITHLQNHITGFQLQVVIGPGLQYQYTTISLEIFTQARINLGQL